MTRPDPLAVGYTATHVMRAFMFGAFVGWLLTNIVWEVLK